MNANEVIKEIRELVLDKELDMRTNEFIEKVRELVLNNAELNKTVIEFFREHPEYWSLSTYDKKSRLVGLTIGINFHVNNDEQIEKARPWFSIDFGYSDIELRYSETLHEKRDEPGVYNCYVGESCKPVTVVTDIK